MWPLVSHLRQNRSHPGIVFHVERCIILLMESINTTGTNMKERKEVLRGEKDVEICNFLLSLRGRILLGQALTIAVKELEKVPSDIRQHSNIWDMKYILDSDIPISLED